MMQGGPPELHRPILTERLGVAGFSVRVEATAEECIAIARRLMVPGVAMVGCDWRLRPAHDGRFEAEGSLRARLRQVCVVTLDEFESEIVEDFAVVFVPGGMVAEAGAEAMDDLDEPDEVPFEADVLDLGEATVEQLALALEPYPRKPGAELPDTGSGEPDSPWAALAKWRTPH